MPVSNMGSGVAATTPSLGGGTYCPAAPMEPLQRAAIEVYLDKAKSGFFGAQTQLGLFEMMSQQERQAQILGKRLPNGVTPTEMIRLRMHIPEREGLPFPHLHAIVHENMVVVFVVTASGEPVSFKDELVMFPTDNLIAKLNLLRA